MIRRVPPDATPPGEKILLPVRTNHLLSAFPADDLRRVEKHLEPVTFEFQQVLHEPDERIRTVFFPESGMCSATVTMRDGGTAEVGATGREGFVGLPVFYGATTGRTLVMCEMPGQGRAMRVEDFRTELKRGGPFYDAVARFALAASVQTMQIAACNRLHTVEERLARWFLMAHDRAGARRFPLTQEFVAFMLGVHRPSVTLVARTLQRAGFIEYQRGIVTIRDRQGLEEAACECYRVIADQFSSIAQNR